MNILNYINLPKKARRDRSRILVNSFVGVVLCLLATIVNTNSGFNFARSTWVLPTVAFTLFSGSVYSSNDIHQTNNINLVMSYQAFTRDFVSI